MSEVTRREAMKTALRAGAYVAPVIVGASAIPQAVGASPPRIPRLVVTPPASAPGNVAAILFTGSGFTPGGTVSLTFIDKDFQSNPKFLPSGGVVVINFFPPLTLTADANGTFSTGLSTVLRQLFQYLLPVGSFTATATDVATGAVATALYSLLDQSLNSIIPTTAPASVPLTAASPGVPGETGRGTVVAVSCQMIGGTSAYRTDIRLTLTGATPNRTFNASLLGDIVPGTQAPETLLSVTTDAAGNASTTLYSFGTLLSPPPVLRLTFPGLFNPIAYRATLTNIVQNCPFA